ncbi:RloB family protein [Xanthomarina sp. GH4-25]|uniref:RloB family protein n=1 Tax=Xanthomarina sp. GH4-25 TaxID=3349335 RepID=UPI003877AB17
MARVTKIDNAILKRLNRKAERDARIVENKPTRKYYLLFCEGARTEPNYFISLKNVLPVNLVQVDIDPSGGKNTLSLVNHAIKMMPRYQRINSTIEFEVWIIFDKDSFPSANFENAINKANAHGYNCAYSNEAFELWYLLHFEDYQNAISRKDYSKLLSNHLNKKYLKNDPDIYNLLQTLETSREDLAIQRAINLEKIHNGKSRANSNPVTRVYKLVEELNSYKEEDE